MRNDHPPAPGSRLQMGLKLFLQTGFLFSVIMLAFFSLISWRQIQAAPVAYPEPHEEAERHGAPGAVPVAGPAGLGWPGESSGRGQGRSSLPEGIAGSSSPVILMYHRVAPASHGGGDGLRVTPERFAAQLQYLRSHGYTPVRLSDVVAYVRHQISLPPQAVTITFDDGYEDVYRYAFPLLKRYGFYATIFVVTGDVGEQNYWDQPAYAPRVLATWDELKQMADSGWVEIGSHTVTHPHLDACTSARVQWELSLSRQLIWQHLGKTARYLSYPYGAVSPLVLRLARRAGYEAAVTTIQGRAQALAGDPLLLPRIRVLGSYNLDQLALALDDPVTLTKPVVPTLRIRLARRLAGLSWPDLTGLGSGSAADAPLRYVPVQQKAVALTFDDGPRPPYTRELLDLLSLYGAHGTFFVVGEMAAQYPDLLREIASRGHELANHTYSHPNLMELSDAGVGVELSNTRELVRALTGVDLRLFRPPGGDWDGRVFRLVTRAGYRTVLWDINAADAQPQLLDLHAPAQMEQAGSAIAAHILARIRPGSIILMHDATPETLDALRILLPALRRQGYQMVTVTQLLDMGLGMRSAAGLWASSPSRRPLRTGAASPPVMPAKVKVQAHGQARHER